MPHKQVKKGLDMMDKTGKEVIVFVDKGGDFMLDIAEVPTKLIPKKHKETMGRMR